MPKRIHIRGAQIVTMDEALSDFASADILIEDGAIRGDGRVLGTYVHGLFDEPAGALAIINHLRGLVGLSPLDADAAAPRPDPYERLAAHFRTHLDVSALYDALGLRIPA